MIPSTPGVTPLRQRMLDDMRMREARAQDAGPAICAQFAASPYSSRPRPDIATVEDLRRFHCTWLIEAPRRLTLNATITGLKFFFDVTLVASS
jgi:hypothetical protein